MISYVHKKIFIYLVLQSLPSQILPFQDLKSFITERN